MKRILSAILCIALTVLLFTACGTQQNAPSFVITDKPDRDELTVTFKSTESDQTLELKLKKDSLSNDQNSVFKGYADSSLYDRAVITSGNTETEQLAYNDYVSGWNLTSGSCYPGAEEYTPKYERKTFDYEQRVKDVLIWTPEDYDASSADKYSVIYMTDGQNLFDRSATATGSWGVAESALMMAQNGGEKCIIVGIENSDGWRDNELTPDIGNVTEDSYKDGHGEYFADFVVDTVMPYINEHYNVYTDREHTHVCGSSSGGIESFYIAMAHPDKFASVGALSPAFLLFDDNTWVDWLSKQDYSQNAPFIYLYCGKASSDQLEQALYAGTVTMPDNLKKINYPEDKIVTKLYDDGIHNEMYWRAVFPDYLKYAFPKPQTEPAK